MNQRHRSKLTKLAQNAELKMDARTGTLFGTKDGYTMYVSNALNGGAQYTVTVSVSREGEMPNRKELKDLTKGSRAIRDVAVQRYKVIASVRTAVFSSDKTLENVYAAIQELVRLLKENGYESCCQRCGKAVATDAYMVSGSAALMCVDCFAAVSAAADARSQAEGQKRENILAGTVGALLGSVIGAVVIVLIGQLGYVASVSGVVIAVCTLKGYQLLGGRLSTLGIVISAAVMLGMIYVGNMLDWAISVASYYEVGVFDAFRVMPMLLSEGYIESSAYYGNLIMLYLFGLIGAVPTVINAIRNRNETNVTEKMSAEQ